LPARRRSVGLKACRECHFLNPVGAQTCGNCGSQKFAELWDGLIILYDVEQSKIAQSLDIKKPGKYALKLY
jgi:DNA-directed RNA polymerase subunit E"